jgi:hypothetical protein
LSTTSNGEEIVVNFTQIKKHWHQKKLSIEVDFIRKTIYNMNTNNGKYFFIPDWLFQEKTIQLIYQNEINMVQVCYKK